VAYVQLKPGARVTESELVGFLGREIRERAAVPRAVRIIEQMPLTAVGKIFKPALKQRETRDALETALREAGIAFHSVGITDDKAAGTTVTVKLEALADPDAARSVLGRFPFPFEVTGAVS
jgi:fatty-acyl-CoA synthase